MIIRTNSHYLTYTLSLWKVGRMYFLSLTGLSSQYKKNGEFERQTQFKPIRHSIRMFFKRSNVVFELGSEKVQELQWEVVLAHEVEFQIQFKLTSIYTPKSPRQFHNNSLCLLVDRLDRSSEGLLEQNKTVGQSARAMVEFPKPPQPEPETDATSDLAPGSDGDKKDEEPSQEVGPRGDKSAKERNGSEPPPPPPRHWFNTVVYGTPTLLLNPAKGWHLRRSYVGACANQSFRLAVIATKRSHVIHYWV